MNLNYKNPPIVEVVFGIQFPGAAFPYEKIYEFYSEELSLDFATITENTALPNIIETTQGATIVKELSGFHTRKFFHNELQNKLIQIQPDRLLFNWKKVDGEADYPSFSKVSVEFFEILDKAYDFFSIQLDPSQYEMTYVNHLLTKSSQNKIDFNLPYSLVIGETLGTVRNFNSAYAKEYIEINGAVNVNIETALAVPSKKAVIKTQSTARGYNDLPIQDWFDVAHELLLDEFVKMVPMSKQESFKHK